MASSLSLLQNLLSFPPLISINSSKSFSICFHKLLFPKKMPTFERTERLVNSVEKFSEEDVRTSRRTMLGLISAVYGIGIVADKSNGAGLPEEKKPRLCDEACEKELERVAVVTTETGLQYKDIQVGVGPSPPIGFQVAANYVAMVPNGQIFDSSLEKGQPYIFRVGSGQVIKGLDEGILSMKIGGKRRLFIPGPLAFPKGLSSAPGRPRVAPNSPVVFDVSLEYIPGLEVDE
uniref:peptidylprolyl isomerase n=1 Tax=Masdevallia picturata TaxID=125444 RepID=A0A0F7H0C6_9ASPA